MKMADELTDEEKRQGLVSPTQLLANKFVQYLRGDPIASADPTDSGSVIRKLEPHELQGSGLTPYADELHAALLAEEFGRTGDAQAKPSPRADKDDAVEEFLRDMPFRQERASDYMRDVASTAGVPWLGEVGEAMPAEIIGSADDRPFFSSHEPLHAAMPSELLDLDSDDGEYFSERLGGPQNVSDTYRQQAGDRVSRVARELGAGKGIFTAPKGTLEQIRKWEETAIDELMVQSGRPKVPRPTEAWLNYHRSQE